MIVLKNLKRLFALIMTLALLVTAMPLSAFAEGEEVLEDDVVLEGSIGEPVEQTVTVTHVSSGNPIYGGTMETYTTEETVTFDPTLAAKAGSDDDAYRAAGLEIRRHLVARDSSWYNLDVISSERDAFTVFKKIGKIAFTHTGNPLEGDYLVWHWKRYNVNWSSVRYGSQWLHHLSVNFTYYTDAAMENQTTNAINNITNSLNLGGKTSYEKMLAIYNWLTTNVTYDYANAYADISHTTYAAVIRRTCVCQGYALTFYRMAMAAGLSCRLIYGNGNGGAHTWNIVKVDGKWYNVDATWDAGNSPSNYRWFLRGSSDFPDHKPMTSRFNNGEVDFFADDFGSSAFWSRYPLASTKYVVTPQQDTSMYHLVREGSEFRCYDASNRFVAYTGVVNYEGSLFYVRNGVLDVTANGLAQSGESWYFLANGQVQSQYTGMAYYNGEWFYVVNGVLASNANGIYAYDGSRFLIAAGRILFTYSGLFQNGGDGIVNADNRWYFISNGQIQTQFSGLAEYNGHWFYLVNGVLDESFTGYYNYNGTVFYIQNGMLV